MKQYMLIHGPGYYIKPNVGDHYEAKIIDEREMNRIIRDIDPDDYDRKGIEALAEAECHLFEHPLAPYGAFGVVLRLLDYSPKDWEPRG